jgi:hypothetical protein
MGDPNLKLFASPNGALPEIHHLSRWFRLTGVVFLGPPGRIDASLNRESSLTLKPVPPS